MLTPGRTLAVAVYRPLAEQLVDIAAPRPGERVLELSAGDGELTARLRAAITGRGSVEVAVRPWDLAHSGDPFDLAVSLLAIDPGDELGTVLPQLARLARRALVAVWTDGATHENALHAAWRDVTGQDLTAVPAATQIPSPPPGWEQSRLSDVARFDGIDQLLLALTDERGISVALDARDALRDRLAHHLTAFTAADGTMRIPVRATLLRLRD